LLITTPPGLLPSPEPTRRTRAALSLREVEERVRELDPDLDVGSVSFRIAVLLLAAPWLDYNIDRLARFAGCSRELVARCARRLYDNGVWGCEGTDALWSDLEDGRAAFWSDVAVAEGLLCRREDAQGRPQWAPIGYWWKSYDFTGPSTLLAANTYYTPPELASESGWDVPVAEELEAVTGAGPMEPAAPEPFAVALPSLPVPQAGLPWLSFGSSDELPDVVWLG
jgi:hypothetical protein